MSHDPNGEFPKRTTSETTRRSHDPNGEFAPPKLVRAVPVAKMCVYCGSPAEHPVLALCLPCGQHSTNDG